MVNESKCPFCNLPSERIIHSNDIGLATRDSFPISPGHTLIIPKRHVDSFFNLSTDEMMGLLSLIDIAKRGIDREFSPQSFNIGINDGPEAGQTIPHLHIHLIPRFTGDLPDPRGGIRWIIPDKANYWSGK